MNTMHKTPTAAALKHIRAFAHGYLPYGATTSKAFKCLRASGLIVLVAAGTYALTDAGREAAGLAPLSTRYAPNEF